MEGMRSERAWDALLKLDKYKTHVKNWRPWYLVLGSIDEKGDISNLGILNLLKQLRRGTGMAIYGAIFNSEINEESCETARIMEQKLDIYMKENK